MAWTFTERTARILARLAKKSQGRQGSNEVYPDQYLPPDEIILKNDSGEAVPAYGCVKVTGAEEDTDLGLYVVTVDKPNNDGGPFLFNGETEIETDGYGLAQLGPMVKATYDDTNTPAVGQTWGPTTDFETVRNGQPAIKVYGVLSTGEFLLGNADKPETTRKAVADAEITVDSTGTVSIYNPDNTDTGDNATAYLDWMHGDENISSGKELIIEWMEDRWIITGADCEDET